MHKKILVIEDEQVSLLLLSKLLNSFGACSLFATTGSRGLTILEDNPTVDLILCDYKLPDINGFDLIGQIRRFPKLKKTPIILCSAYLSIKQITSVMDAGANSFLPKPIKKKELFECLENNLTEAAK